MLIHEKMIGIMKDISAIGKEEKNKMQGFNFRGIDTVYNDLHNLFKKHEIFCLTEVLDDKTEERKTAKGGNLIYRVLKVKFSFVAVDGSSVDSIVIGEGMDSGDKASNKAMSIGHKYALLQAFLIPTDDKEKDPDYNTPPKNTKTEQVKNTFNAETVSEKKEFNRMNAIDKIESLMVKKAWPEEEIAVVRGMMHDAKTREDFASIYNRVEGAK